jgi:hypothetical protein
VPTLSKELRRILENTVADARRIAEAGAEQALKQLAVDRPKSKPAGTAEEKAREEALHEKLRAHGKQLGDRREPNGTQELKKLKQACAYEHWHRMLFARFLAEGNLLIHPEYGEAISLEEIKELAREQNADWLSIAASYAQQMLLEVFRSDDPVLALALPPETHQYLDEKLAGLPKGIFLADDSLGWVYQYWQRDETDRVNKSEVKIGADELPPKTQFFTEDYMVLSLLENTLGAWWTAKCIDEGKDPTLAGYTWTYLRLSDDGSPVAGKFDGWPRTAKELRVLDPCMGSGHFLVFALPILARMRMTEEVLTYKDAITATLSENLFGLELDARCAQIAAFNLAMAAWRLAGEHYPLPQLHLACSGLGINTPRENWVALAGKDGRRQELMGTIYELFRNGPTLGSLIDPQRTGLGLIDTEIMQLLPAIEEALSAEQAGKEDRELAIAAQGTLAAFRILVNKFTLVATNVPYLGRGKQAAALADYCERFYSDASADLASCFIDRSLRFLNPGGSIAMVTKQEILYLTDFKELRPRLLREETWNLVAKLGSRAFQAITGEVVSVVLLVVSRKRPIGDETFVGIDALSEKTPAGKALALQKHDAAVTSQSDQLNNPDAIVVLGSSLGKTFLRTYANAWQGIATSDLPRFGRSFWELPSVKNGWVFQQSVPKSTDAFRGRESILYWQDGIGAMTEVCQKGASFRGQSAWGKQGVVIGQMSSLPVCLYTGEHFSNTVAVLIP